MADPFDGKKLAEALRSGQPDQVRAAFDRHYDAMERLARALTGRGKEDVSRLIEAVWVSAVADFPQAEPQGSARAWLFARLLDRCDPLPGMPGFEPADDRWEGHWTDFPVPWRVAEDWERTPEGRSVLERALDSLPPLERTVLILRDLDGWSPSEVGGLTQLMPEQEQEVLFRARLAIRAAIDPILREPATAGDDGHG